jgi:hypothetical protein
MTRYCRTKVILMRRGVCVFERLFWQSASVPLPVG